MAPLDSNNTGVLFLDYSVGGEGHTVQARYAPGSGAADMMDMLHDFLTAITTKIYLMHIEGARHRAANAVNSFPIAWTGDTDYGTGVATHVQSASYLDYIGRSTLGRHVRLSLFGAIDGYDILDSDFRVPTTGVYGDGLAELVARDNVVAAIDGAAVVWYPYVNLGQNAYWRNRIR